MQNWELSLARIEYGTDDWATGWLCSQEGHLLTCGHIFADGNDDLPIDGVAGDGLSCDVRFPGHDAVSATVVRYWRTESRGVDFAVLQIAKEDLPDGVSPLKVGRFVRSCEVILYGHGEGQAHILSPESGKLIGPVHQNDNTSESERDPRAGLLKADCAKANVPGFSGTPAYCDDTGTVVAMQSGGGDEENPDADCVYFMPISRAEELWEPLAELLIRGDPVDLINAALIEERANHPSFTLMKDGFDEGLLPYSQIPNASRDVKVDEGDVISLSKCIRRSWEGGQTHLFIEGKGGVGKTVALLTFATEKGFLPRNTAAVYIPLYKISKYVDKGGDCIDEYVTRHFSRKLAEEISELSFSSWDNGPNLILLLDGYNEIPPDNRDDIEEDILEWAKRAGTQVVTTSRIPVLTKPAKTTSLELCELSKDAVTEHLKSRGIRVPKTRSSLMRLLETPLMLRLYVRIMKHRLNNGDDAEQIENESSASAGGLVRDYLQTELELYTKRKRLVAKRTCIEALLLTLPYVCWRMESAHEFDIDDAKLSEYIGGAIERWRNNRLPTSVTEAEKGLRPRTATDIDKAMVAFNHRSVLEEATGLVLKRGDKYVLAHQSLRDGMAAIHLLNAAESSPGPLPDEFMCPISEPVKDYFADVIGGEILLKLWEANRRTRPTNTVSTDNLLRVFYQLDDGNLEKLDWSGMDLRSTNLYRFRKGIRVELSRRPIDFEETQVQLDCFLPLGHSAMVTSACFSPDGTLLASGSRDGTVLLWDLSTGLPKFGPLVGHGGKVTSVCFSRNGKLLASSSEDGTIRLWDPGAGSPVGNPLGGHGSRVTSVCFSQDGKLLASGSWDGTVLLWDLKSRPTKSRPLVGHGGRVTSVCFSQDGKLLASGSVDRTVRLWDPIARVQLGDPMTGHERTVTSVCFSQDGRLMASGSVDRTVRLWNPTTKLPVCDPLKGHGGRVTSVCFSRDGSLLASGSGDRTVRLWDPTTGLPKSRPLGGRGGQVTSVCFSHDGSLLASCSRDRTVRLWDPATGLPKGRPLGGHQGLVMSACFSRDGSLLASGSMDGTIRLWNSATGIQIGKPFGSHGSRIDCICFSQDGSLLVSGSVDGAVQLWDPFTGAPKGKPLEGHRGRVTSVCFSRDGSLLASGSVDGTVRLWNPVTGTPKGKPLGSHRGRVTSVCFSWDGKLLASGFWDGTVRLWNPDTGLYKGRPLRGHRGRVTSVCFSRDGKLLASGSVDGTVCLWEPITKRLKCEPLGNNGGPVTSISFSPDGSLLAIGTENGTVRLWDAGTGEPKDEPINTSHYAIRSISYSSNGIHTIGLKSNRICVSSISLAEPHTPCSPCFTEPSGVSQQIHIKVLHGIDITGLDFSLAQMDERTREVLRQNGAKA